MKEIIIIALTIFIFTNVKAQDSKMNIGVKGSPTSIFLIGNDIVKDDLFRLSYSIGVSFDYYINSQLSLKTGISYDRKGNKRDIQSIDEESNPITIFGAKSNYDYLVLPFLLSYSKSQDHAFYINAGIFVGYLFNSNYESAIRSVDNYDSNKKIDLGFSFGFGWEIPLSNEWILDFGLLDHLGLINTSSIPVYNDGTIKTNSIELKIGLKYKL